LNRSIDSRAHEIQRRACISARERGKREQESENVNLDSACLLTHASHPFKNNLSGKKYKKAPGSVAC